LLAPRFQAFGHSVNLSGSSLGFQPSRKPVLSPKTVRSPSVLPSVTSEASAYYKEVAKELVDEQVELIKVVKQAIRRKINKTDLSYLINNDKEIVVDKNKDIFDEIVERLRSLELESKEEEASILVLAKNAI
jgi:hypothetical protein